jgi:uncharacterized protein YuzE
MATTIEITQGHKEPYLIADYDQQADVLYLSLGKPRPAEGEDYEDGIVLRYAISDNSPSGITVIGFKLYDWDKRLAEFITLASKQLSIKPALVKVAIRKYFKY